MTVTDDLQARREQIAQRTLASLRVAAMNAATEDEAAEVAAQIRAFARRVRASWWSPYPWQHPHEHPPGWVSTRRASRPTDARPGLGVCDDRCLLLPAASLSVHETWLQRGGRGTGKTEGAAHYVDAHVNGPPCDSRVPGGHRLTIVAPTQPDAVTSCVTGVTGLQAINPEVTVSTGREGTIVRWPSGAVGRLLGAHTQQDVQRARAWTNVCLWWVEEAAAMNWLGGLSSDGEPEGMLDQAPFTLRLGDHPHTVATSTPTNRPEVIRLIRDSRVQTWGRTQDAERLPEGIRDSLESKYRGTTLGRQELDGEVINDVVGAMWIQRRTVDTDPTDDRPALDNDRVGAGTVGWTPHMDVADLTSDDPDVQAILDRLRPMLPDPPDTPTLTVDRVAVGVDPAGGATENGIVVVGLHADHGYTLADLTLKAGPSVWGILSLLAWQHFGAEGVALERFYGGDQTDHVLATAARTLGLPMPALLRAPVAGSKKQRAQPVQTLGQVHRLHHVGTLAKLEGEQVTWVEDETPESPNRLDAYVHAVRHLLVQARTATTGTPARRRRTRGVSSTWASGR